MGVRHPVTAFYLDRVVYGFGAGVDSEIDLAQSNAKTDSDRLRAAQMVLNKWFRSEGGGRYRDPAAG